MNPENLADEIVENHGYELDFAADRKMGTLIAGMMSVVETNIMTHAMNATQQAGLLQR